MTLDALGLAAAREWAAMRAFRRDWLAALAVLAGSRAELRAELGRAAQLVTFLTPV